MKVISFCFEHFFNVKNKNDLVFHPRPVQPPSGEGSPLMSNGTLTYFLQQSNNLCDSTARLNRQMLGEMKREIQSIKNQPDQTPQERRQQLAGLGLSGQNVPWQS